MYHNTIEEERVMAMDNTRKNLLKFGHTVFELCEQTDRQQTDRCTKRQTNYNTSQL